MKNLPPLSGAILITNPRKDLKMGRYRRNAGRTKLSKEASRRRMKPRSGGVPGLSAVSTQRLRAAASAGEGITFSPAQVDTDLKSRTSTRAKRGAAMSRSNPKRRTMKRRNPKNAYNQWVKRWIKRNKSKLKGKSGIAQIKAAHAAWKKLKRKPASYTDKTGAKRRRGDQKRKKGAKRTVSKWQKFLKRNKGKNYTMQQLSDAYKKNPMASLKTKASAKAKKATSGRRESRASGRMAGAGRRKPQTGFQKFAERTGIGRSTTPTLAERTEKEAAKKAAGKAAYKATKDKLLKAKKSGAIDMTPGEIQAAARRAEYRVIGGMAANNPFGALALKNGLALDNPTLTLGQVLSPRSLFDITKSDIAPVVVGAAIGGGAHAVASAMGVTDTLIDGIDGLPVVGEWLGSKQLPFFDQSMTELLPYSIQGSVVFLATGLLAGLAPVGFARNLLVTTGASALAFGGGIDAFNFVSGRMAGSGEEDALQALEEEIDNMGGLALDNASSLGGLALDNMGGLALDNFGDGFAYHTAPLQAAQNAGEFEQCSYADAYYSGADFSGEEGQALLNGPRAFFGRFGKPTRRIGGADKGKASHLAGRRGHRWGWLVRMCGWPKAQQIASLAPADRLRVIKAMRQGAMEAYQQASLLDTAVAVEASTLPTPELVPAAGTVASAPEAPGGPVGAMGASYGAPFMFAS